MNDEIKEILEDLRNKNMSVDDLTHNDKTKLLDYITNLQEENQKLKKIYIKPTFTKRKIEELQQENLKLKEVISSVKEDYLNERAKVDAAIEYIKDSGITFLNLANQRCFCNNNCADKIINILNGGDEE